MTMFQALILGLIQGVGELMPVSSLAQTILLPALLGWDINAGGTDFLAFVVALHLATAVALFIYFWKDWRKVFSAYAGSLRMKKLVYDRDSKFAWLLVAGTIVVAVVGGLFEKKFRTLFDDSRYYWVVAVILILNGFAMILGDYLKKLASKIEGIETSDPAAVPSTQKKAAEEMTFTEGTLVGAAQTLALFPGVSRSGMTIVAGLLFGLSYESASRFSFMLATPVIGLAAILKLPSLMKDHHAMHLAVPAALVSGVTAYLSVAFLMQYFKHNRLSPFGYYCIGFGTVAWVILAHRAG